MKWRFISTSAEEITRKVGNKAAFFLYQQLLLDDAGRRLNTTLQPIAAMSLRIENMNNKIPKIIQRYQADQTRLLDMLWDLHHLFGYIPDDALSELANGLNMSLNDARETRSFYHYFHDRPSGKYTLYLSDTVIARMNGYQAVQAALERESGAPIGGMDPTGTFGLYSTPCVGLSDQEPVMLVDEVVFTRLTPEKVSDIISQLKQGRSPEEIANPSGLPKDDIAYVDQLVETTIHQAGPVFFQQPNDFPELLNHCLDVGPDVVIETITAAKLRGHGGAGFSTGLKWRLCREAAGAAKYVICNADEGEPGTFKDRALLTRSPQAVFMGMVLAASVIGAREGIIYLRQEYIYLKAFLEKQLQLFREQQLLGNSILGRAGFNFDIRIQMGAGAYVCGDESALIESCEGKRGTPRVKPPYPVEQGYLGMPTCVNNVETLVAVTRVLQEGADWYQSLGVENSRGSRLMSVSGDCDRPGIYEVEWGTTLNQVLSSVGAIDPWAVQISGPSGECVAVEKSGERCFGYSDLACNGSLMIFNHSRDLLSIVKHFMQFFVDESCGICTPCRAGNVDLHNKVERVMAGRACQQDLDEMVSWGSLVRSTSRCGLGGTSPNPILTTLKQFPEIYQAKLTEQQGALLPSFDLQAALMDNEQARIELTQKELNHASEAIK
ncbi:NAD(P)H-dependent oxidoreductase subunit E [uncultured Amphritea sp.]|uniref:NAD(P)H-dependent oxidoreductase subunit E n=1 Tax=uncultured Amphritea sp. TaxID=981605 RepID=UPI00262E5BB9|nr:NAD(P)H-dependent oxidoreductase subunit E [uncultured Amphritea sp.]